MSSSLEIEERGAVIPFTDDEEVNDEGKDHGEVVEDDDDQLPGMRGVRFSASLMIAFWALCIILREVMESIDYTHVKCGVANKYSNDSNALMDCVRHTAIFRVATVLVVILVGQILLTIGLGTESAVVYWDNYFLLKLAFLIIVSFSLLYPEGVTFFDDQIFAWIARFGGFIFIIFQSLVFLDWAYQFNEYCKSSTSETSGATKSLQRTFDGVTSSAVGAAGTAAKTSLHFVGLLVFALINLSGFAFSMAMLYKYFANEGCSENIWIITISVVIVVVATIIQLDGKRSTGSLTTTGILGLYIAYTSYSAVALHPKAECNTSMVSSDVYGIGPVVLGIILSFCSVLYITIVAARKIATIITTGPIPFFGIVGVVAGYNSSADYGTTGTKVDYDNTHLKVLIINLNVVFLLVTFYISMIMTNWGNILGWTSVGGATNDVAALATSVGGSNASMYMNAIGGWLAGLLYIVALCIPTWSDCFPTSIWQLRFKTT